MPTTDLDASLSRLDALAAGLVYSSEGDHPFHTVQLGTGVDEPLTEARVRELLALPADAPVAVVGVERVLGRHTIFTDPFDLEAQAIRPRYEAIVRFFEGELADSVAIRTGCAPAIDVWILGRTPAGKMIGYRTVAIET